MLQFTPEVIMRSVKTFSIGAALVVLAAIQVSAGEPVQICSADKLAAIRASLPRVADKELAALLVDPTTLWYTNAEMPPAYQFAETGSITGGRVGTNPQAFFLDVRYNISGDPGEASKGHGRGGNGNVEFPWRTAGGLDAAETSTAAYRFLHLPLQAGGEPWPVVVYTATVFMPNTRDGAGRITGGLNQFMTGWTYPHGTTFGEVLYQARPGGDLVAFEIRTRTKNKNAWDVDILRPFPQAKDLASALEDRGQTALAATVLASAPQPKTLVDRSHPTRSGFATAAAVDELPAMPAELVDALLTKTEFRSALGRAWKSADDEHAFAPTAKGYSIVPPGYAATFLGSDSASCMNCHQHTMKHVNEFHLSRDWYGTIRGSDGIFTWHPMHPGCVAVNNRRITPTLRPEFVAAGMVARYDESLHPSSVYLQTKVAP